MQNFVTVLKDILLLVFWTIFVFAIGIETGKNMVKNEAGKNTGLANLYYKEVYKHIPAAEISKAEKKWKEEIENDRISRQKKQ